jgi:hypothetical protein
MILTIAVRRLSLLVQWSWMSRWKVVFWAPFRRVCCSCRFISSGLSNNKNRGRYRYMTNRSHWFISFQRLIISSIILFLSLKWPPVQERWQRQLFCLIKSMRLRCVVLREDYSLIMNWPQWKVHLIWIWLNLIRKFTNKISLFPNFRSDFCLDRQGILSFLPLRHL